MTRWATEYNATHPTSGIDPLLKEWCNCRLPWVLWRTFFTCDVVITRAVIHDISIGCNRGTGKLFPFSSANFQTDRRNPAVCSTVYFVYNTMFSTTPHHVTSNVRKLTSNTLKNRISISLTFRAESRALRDSDSNHTNECIWCDSILSFNKSAQLHRSTYQQAVDSDTWYDIELQR